MRKATVKALATNSGVRVMQWRCPHCDERQAWDQCGDGLYPQCLFCGQQVKLTIGEREPSKITPRPFTFTSKKRKQ